MSPDTFTHMLLYLNPQHVHTLLFLGKRLSVMVSTSSYWRRWTVGMENFQSNWGESFRTIEPSQVIAFVVRAASYACKRCERYKVSDRKRYLCIHCSPSSAEDHAKQVFYQSDAMKEMILPRSVAHRVPWEVTYFSPKMVIRQATKAEIEAVCLAYYGSEQRYFRAMHDAAFRREVARQQPEHVAARLRAQRKRTEARTVMEKENTFIETEWLPHIPLSKLCELLEEKEGKKTEWRVPKMKKKRDKFIAACCECLAELQLAGQSVNMLPALESVFEAAVERVKKRNQKEAYEKMFGKRDPRKVLASLYPFEEKAKEAKLPPLVYDFLLQIKESDEEKKIRSYIHCDRDEYGFGYSPYLW